MEVTSVYGIFSNHMVQHLACFFSLLLVLCHSSWAKELGVADCHDRGFNKDTLQCSSCSELSHFHLDVLSDDCKACCAEDADELQHEKYPFAQIEICECNLGRFPQVQAFVKSDMVRQWGSRVKVRHVRGTLPTIKLKDLYGETQQTMNIEKWDTDTITEFLNMWLES